MRQYSRVQAKLWALSLLAGWADGYIEDAAPEDRADVVRTYIEIVMVASQQLQLEALCDVMEWGGTIAQASLVSGLDHQAAKVVWEEISGRHPRRD